MTTSTASRRLLLAGGGGGLLGRALLEQVAPSWTIRSVHRHPSVRERELGVEWVARDLADVHTWDALLDSVDVVVNVAWYRWGSEARFRDLHDALLRLVDAAHRRGVPIVHVSVPPAPDRLERRLPYLTYKRRVDDAVRSGGGPYSIVRPTLMFGAGDVLLGVMLRAIRTYGFFPMFGDGSYRISPVSSHDVARLVGRLLEGPSRSTLDLGGPGAFRYRDVTDRMFALLGRRPRYWSLSARGSVRLARLMQSLRSGKLYAYEVEWLLSDTLALPRSPRMDWPMERVEPYLRSEVSRLTGESAPDLGPLPERG